MRLTTKGRYAITAMLDLALNAKTMPVSLADIADRQQISISYLEQLFAKLRRRELVKSVRGPGGGYMLGQPATEIYIADIVQAIDENRAAKNGAEEVMTKAAATQLLWESLSDQIHGFLSDISLAQLIESRDLSEPGTNAHTYIAGQEPVTEVASQDFCRAV